MLGANKKHPQARSEMNVHVYLLTASLLHKLVSVRKHRPPFGTVELLLLKIEGIDTRIGQLLPIGKTALVRIRLKCEFSNRSCYCRKNKT